MTHEPFDTVLEHGDAALAELDGVAYLTYPALDELGGVRALTTLREHGEPVLSRTLADWDKPVVNVSEAVRKHATVGQWLARALDVPRARFASGRQTHDDRCVIVTEQNAPSPGELSRFPGTDALLTRQAGVALVVLTADCVPIFLADPVAHAIGIVHAGKVGTRKQIAARIAGVFFDTLGAEPARSVAVIGPSIGDGCYPDRLWEENVRQLRAAGFERIIESRLCTRCNLEHCYSYRAEKGCTGRMLSAIILPES